MELNSALVLARRSVRRATIAALGAALVVLLLGWLAWRLRLQRNRAEAAEHALAGSERHYRSLIELMPDSVFVLNLDGSLRKDDRRSSASPPGWHGAAPEAAPEQSLPAETAERLRASIGRVLESGAMVAEEVVSGDGRWMETRLLPVRGDDGQIQAIMGISRDISARKRAEAELTAQRERFRRIIESSTAGYFRIGLDGRYQAVNQAWLAMHGCADESEAIGHHYSEFQVEADLAGAEAVVAAVFAGGSGQGEFSRRCKDGSTGYHTYSVSPVLDGAELAGIEGFLIDTTARRSAEVARRQVESRYAALFNHMAEGVALHEILFDGEGRPANYRILDVNPRYEEILGRRASDVIGRLATEAYGASEPPYLAEYNAACSSGNGSIFETYFPPVEKHFSIAVAPLDRTRFATIFTDITTRKRADEDRARLEEQLRQAQKMESIGRLAGGIAHDFNNLLTVINGYADMLLAGGALAEGHRTALGNIAQAGRRAASLTAQLLAFSRRQIIQPRPTNLNQVVTEAGELLRRLISENIELKLALAPDLGLILADPGQLHQVLMNLVLNARDAMVDGGELLIETANVFLDDSYAAKHVEVTPGPAVMLAVTDTGHGMDGQTLARVFEPFFSTKGPGSGTGLGLATVYGIVRQNGGWIWAYSEPGRGSTFKIYLPRRQGALSIPEPALVVNEKGGSETVLLVEDQEEVRKFASLALRSFGYRVLEADNGLTAIDLAREHDGAIDLLLTDVVMPGIGGRELAERLRNERPGIKVLFTTGYTENVIVQQGVLKAGFRYLAKPFTLNTLSAKVRETLDSRE
jgi:PAS domain S-box-containing protein